MPFVRLGAALIHYADEGPRGAPALVLINSLGTDFRIWDAVAGALRPRHRIVRADKRGHGLSGPTTAPGGIGDYADDVAALMDHLQLPRAVIVGVSMGGLIAQELHRRRPALVGALVLSDTAVKIGDDEMWNARIATIEKGGIEAIADAIMLRWFSAGFRASRTDEFAGYRAMLVRQPQDGYITACRAVRDSDLRAHAGAIRAPTLCLVGEEDGSTPPALVRETAGLIAGARFELIAGAGHLPGIERPALVARLIAEHAHLAVA